MRNVGCLLWVLVLVAGTMGGCARVDYTTADRYDRGLVLCVGGAGGVTGEANRVRKGLNDGGVDWALEKFKWSRYNALKDQTDIKANKLKAKELAKRVQSYRRDYPGRQVYLVGVSAGTGLVVWALEELPAGEKADGAVLLASSLEAKYDLSRAMENVAGQIYSFYSRVDPILRLGVPLVGSVDRSRTLAIGGADGFKVPTNADNYTQKLYEKKLSQRSWQPGDVWQGNAGGHLGTTNPAFVRKRIAPLILGRKID